MQPPPLVGPVLTLRDSSLAVRSRPGGNAAKAVDLLAARTRIGELERALQERDSRYAATRRKAQDQWMLDKSDRERLEETVALLERALRVAETPAEPSVPPADTQPDVDTTPPLPTEEPLDPVLDPINPDNGIGSVELLQAQDDYQQLEERLEKYIEQMNQTSQRIAAAAREVVVQSGPDAVEPLILLLDSRDPAVLLWALETLQQMGPIAGEAADLVLVARIQVCREAAQALLDAFGGGLADVVEQG